MPISSPVPNSLVRAATEEAAPIGASDADYAFEIVKKICTEVGPGMPGTAGERERAGVIRRELEAQLGAGNVTVEEFSVAPWGCLGSLPLSAAFMLVAAALNVSAPHLTGIASGGMVIGGLVFAVLSPLVYLLEFILGLELVDRWFEQERSSNVIGALRGPGMTEVRKLLIVSGHHDSAPENTWLALLGYGMVVASVVPLLGYFAVVAMSAIQTVGVVVGNTDVVRVGTMGWGMLAFPIVPAAVYGLFFNRGRENGGTVPGAIDNLSGSALVLALSRFLSSNPWRVPRETEIRFITFGSEEAGLRGSRRYVERHLDELKRLDARLLNFEMVAQPEIGILTSDAHGTVKHSRSLVESVVAAAERAGVPYEVKGAYLGVATDAASFSKAGLHATTLLPFKAPQQMVAFYHQKSDRPEALDREALLNVLKLASEWISHAGEK